MGTPEFAVASLQAIHESIHEVVAVVTVADKPSGRGRRLRPSAVKAFASAHNLPVLQPLKLRDEAFISELRNLQADVFVVVAFRMLPKTVWEIPPLGTMNLHGSLLPQYRGAAPIHRAVMDGATETGCTTFLINEEIDTGAILLRERIEIGLNETTGDVHDRMMVTGAQLLLRTLDLLESKELTPIEQHTATNEQLRPAPKLFKEDCRINWSRAVSEVHDFVRGLSPFPSAWTLLEGDEERSFKILNGRPTDQKTTLPPGEIRATRHELFVSAGDAFFKVTQLQPAGKPKMQADAFLRGHDVNGLRFI